MKKAFLFLTMLLFAFAGTMRAGVDIEVEVGTASTTNSYIPDYTYYDYSVTQQIYTAAEIGYNGTINAISFDLASGSATRSLNVYMKHVTRSTFSGTSDWESMSDDDMVYSGSVTWAAGWTTITLATPFEYNGTDNLLVCVYDQTGDYVSSQSFRVYSAGSGALRVYRDNTPYDVTSLSGGAVVNYKNHIKLNMNIELGPSDITVLPSSLDLGYRPNGAWMRPGTLYLNNTGNNATVSAVESNNSFFTVNTEVPFAVNYGEPVEVEVGTGTTTAGAVEGQIMVAYADSRNFTTVNVEATAYDPVDGDVWEMAEEVTAMPFQGNAPSGIYKNYDLPTTTEGADAVYQVTFDEDVLFSAGTNGANAAAALYTEDFNGVGGPDDENNYVYNGPTVNPGPMSMWFAYAYSGTNTWYGTSAGGGIYFGYKIPASYIEELGLEGTSITTVESAARESYDYECYIVKGGDTPFDGELVSFGVAENPQALYFFDINLEEPVLVGADEDIWVIFYTDSPYAAYCGRTPVDANNGKIWVYNPNASSPAWSSNTAYTPVIYTRFLELPTGREVTVDLGTMTVKTNPNAVESAVAALDGTAMGVSKAQKYNEAKAQNTRGNRDTQTLIEEGWENGIGDWTKNNCESATDVYAGDANSGSNCFRFRWTTSTPQYLISPELTDNNGGTMSFYCRAATSTYPESYRIGYSTTTNDISAFTFGDEVTVTSLLYAEHTATFPAGTKYIAIASTANDAYYFYVDDITITADITSGGGGSTDAVYQIADMYVPAGTYYVAVASTDDNFQVDMMTSEVPLPEQAVVVSPYDGETNVESPYLAEWVLGNYTTEMQVLVGTQYPPQTALIDWTDELVESAFLLDLEPNQSYFMQVNARNAAGTTYGEIIAFATPIDPVEGFEVAEANLYPGDAAVFTWNANRSFQGYNLYQDGVKVNDEVITENTYSVEGLEYNMTGYEFAVTAVYDAGESDYSDIITVKMTGNGIVSGTVYEQDSTTVIPNATIEFRGTDEFGMTNVVTLYADESGAYSGEVLAGNFTPVAYKEGYAECAGTAMTIAYGETYEDVNIYVHEFYYPLGMINATEEDADVLVEWSWTPAEMLVDFETGDFSQAEFDNTGSSYPWAITTTNPYEGTYAMKSTCESIASGVSYIEATVDVPFDGLMGFWVRVSSETNYDKFHFYIDGVEQGSALSGNLAYSYKEFAVTEGTHTYKWEYAKDSSVNSNDDCVYVDNIYMYKQAGPQPSGQTYTFDGSSMEGWTSLDADGDGYGWMLGSACDGTYLSGGNLAGAGHNSSADLVTSGSYSNVYGVLTPDNYLVSPAKIAAQDGAAITFWACAQDASYASEHFGVAVSTGSNTSAADFTTIQEWTMTAKSARLADEDGTVRGTRAQGSWYEYTVDLSAYAGQEIWVAIRHFNCSDQFLLNVDDITLGDGSEAKAIAGDRTFQSFNLYRRNNYTGEETLIATPAADVFEYTDAAWANLSFGEYQWGIQASYAGNAPTDRNRDEHSFAFTSDMNNWTTIDNDGDGRTWFYSMDHNVYDYTGYGHGGDDGFIVSASYEDNGGGAFDADNYIVAPEKYTIGEGASITFYADNANDTYPDYFEVVVSTAGNTSASDFTAVWGGNVGSKSGSDKAAVRNNATRYGNWRLHTVDLSAYAGQQLWIGFHHQDYDEYEIWIDDVTINTGSSTPTPTPEPGDGLSEILWSNVIDKDMVAEVTFNVALNNGQNPAGVQIIVANEDNEYTATVDETGVVVMEVRKGEYLVSASMEDYTPYASAELIEDNEVVYNIVLEELINPVEGLYVSPTGWAKWDGNAGNVTPSGEGQWYFYGDDNQTTGVGAGGAFYWAVMFPAGTYEGNTVTKVANYGAHDDTYGTNGAFTGSVTIYNDGTTVPTTAVGTMDITMPDTDELIEFEFPTPVTIDPTKNLWVVFYNSNSTDYIGSCCNDSGDANGRWVSLDGTSWMDLATAGVPGYNWMIKVYVASGKGEVQEISVPTQVCNNAGALAMVEHNGNRAPLSYKVMLDGAFVGETTYPFYQHDVEGMEEGSEHITAVAPLYASGMGDWSYYTWTYAACSNYAGVNDFTIETEGNTATLSWVLGNNPNPNPPTTTTYNFDGSSMEGWTSIDADGDGYGWILGSACDGVYLSGGNLSGAGHNSSADLVVSGSYSNVVGALTPDNYLVSPAKAAYASISFWACAQDASYAAEHFGVAVSTTDATSSAFTMVQEWTMTAKGSGVSSLGRDGQTRAQGSWHEYTVDLSAYAGQEIWVAIRHFNCTDQFILNVDDITLGAAGKGRAELYEPHFVTDPGAMSNGADASWTKGSQTTWGPNANNTAGYLVGDDFTLTAATTISEIEVYAYQTGSTTTSTFTGLYAQIYDGNPMSGGQVVWGDATTNIMTSTSFTNCYRGSDGDVSATTRPIMAVTASNLSIELEAGTYYLVWGLTGSLSSGPWAAPEAEPGVGNTGNGIQYTGSSWTNLTDSGAGTTYGAAFKLVGEGGSTPSGNVLGVMVWRDGELLTPTPLTTNTYVDEGLAEGEYEYCVRVVYDDYAMSCPECLTIEVGEVSCDPVTNLTATYYNEGGQEGGLLQWEGNANSYKVYVDSQLLGSTSDLGVLITGLTLNQTYTMGIVAVYDNCESDMVTVQYTHGDDGVIDDEIVNAIYPNPTSGDLHIYAEAMTRVSVFNAMGQMVYDQAVSGNEMTVNMGQFESGVYMVKVTTETGSSLKRITVVK